MAVVRVNTATGFSSDDFFGAADSASSGIGLDAGALYVPYSPAYGRALVTAIHFGLSPSAADFDSYTGTLSSLEARAGTTSLATMTFATAVPISWNGGFELYFSPALFRFFNSSLPASRFSGADDMLGNAGADVFNGYAGNDLLAGAGGNDFLFGGAGNDTLNGGVGSDNLFGEEGNDTFVVDGGSAALDRIFGGQADGKAAPGEINTLVLYGLNDLRNAFFSQIQRLSFANSGATANFHGTQFTATSEFGISSRAAVVGGTATDTLVVSAQPGRAINLAALAFSNWSAADQIQINGTVGIDTLIGTSQKDTIRSLASADVLDGRGGADVMRGGAGNDFYYVDNAGDRVDEGVAGSDGIDTVVSAISLSLLNSANLLGDVERLALSGAANVNATGNALANTLIGNGAANILNGLAGDDLLWGRGGNDTYVVDTANDTVDESISGSGGVDTVWSYVNFSLSNTARVLGAVENLALAGTATAGTGNAFANVLTGNASANVLSGLNGNDTLRGGLGIDSLTGGANNDIFVFNTAPNISTNRDLITDFYAPQDTFQLENAIFTRLGAGVHALNPAFFKAGAAPADANDYLVYNRATGNLFYDLNGNGAGGATLFATLLNKPVLTASDFVVI